MVVQNMQKRRRLSKLIASELETMEKDIEEKTLTLERLKQLKTNQLEETKELDNSKYIFLYTNYKFIWHVIYYRIYTF